MIAVLDFGGQYAHLIANRVRRLGVYSEIFDGAVSAEKLRGCEGVILSGGPQSVYEKGAPQLDPKILKLGVPVLGICYGHQMLVRVLGGDVKPGNVKEYGLAKVHFSLREGLFKGMKAIEQVWMSHGDEVVRLPAGMKMAGSTSTGPFAAIADTKRHFYGTQFHLEVTHTPGGMKMLDNFLAICKAKRNWNLKTYVKDLIKQVQTQAKGKKVFMMISGGVDSTVAFSLLEKALGADRVYGLFVDTGFMRKNELRDVSGALKKLGFKNLHIYNGKRDFFDALKGVYEPEEKRRIIGNMFLTIQRKVVAELKLNPKEWLLGQGTIYPDTIEAGGTKHSALIKTHHNRVPEVEALMKKGLVIEPLKDLYKDEVRIIGDQLGLEKKIVWRHPFPGPGLAVRCLCAEKNDLPKDVKKVEAMIETFLKPYKLKAKILPIKSVGVQGDGRTYRHPVALFGKMRSWDELSEISTQLTNLFGSINRVLFTLIPENLKKVTVKKGYLTPARIELLQEADKISMDTIDKAGLHLDIWQFPTVMIPVSVNDKKGDSIVLRPVSSTEAMTANFFPMQMKVLEKIVARMRKLSGVSAIFYDITHKPPGTIEWE